MELEKQVTSLELSKRLKELGVKQESLFYHAKVAFKAGKGYEYHNRNRQRIIMKGRAKKWQPPKDFCSAFTVAELGELLPQAYSRLVVREARRTMCRNHV